jgi:hypothetical protein
MVSSVRIVSLFLCAALLLAVSACSLDSRAVGAGRMSPPPGPEKNKPPETMTVKPSAMDKFRALAPPEGFKLTPLFSEKINDPDARLTRLEDAVQGVRNDLDTVVPAMAGMISIKAEPVNAETAPKPAAAVTGTVRAVRIADHPDKTRMVLDMTANLAATAKIENNGKTLVIPLPQMNWPGKQSWEADSAQLISGYHVKDGSLYVDLMYPSQIKTMEVLRPGAVNKNYRLVIDLFSSELHK